MKCQKSVPSAHFRYVSVVTTPTCLSPVGLLSPVTPSSPPSEMSAPLSSLATSVPSMATSPSGEEERPLLFRTPPVLRDKCGSKPGHNLRNSAHYNHGLELLSPPASPLHIDEDDGEDESSRQPSPPHSPVHHHTRRTQQTAEASPASTSNSESSGSESEDEDTPFLGSETPPGTAATCAGSVVADGLEGNRTNPALHLSTQEHLQNRLANIIVKQDPIAV